MKIYFAAPLFSEAEASFNSNWAESLRSELGVEVYLPQEQDDINDKSQYANSIDIAKYDTDELLTCDLVVAVLDGLVIDPGVAAEVGVAWHAGIPVIGVCTDQRQCNGYDNNKKLEALSQLCENQFSYVNLYVVGLIKQRGTVVSSKQQMVEEVKKYV